MHGFLLSAVPATPAASPRLEAWAAEAHRRLGAEPADAVVEGVRADLWLMRRSLSPEAWQRAIGVLRQTPLVAALRQDPFSRHASDRPRGYPGDAPLLDWIYEGLAHPQRPAPGTVAAALHGHSVGSPACAAVRWRRDHLSARLAALPAGARALSLACGHLREAAVAVQRGARLPELHGLDQDPASLAEVRRSLADQPVVAHEAGVRELLRGELPAGLDHLDLAYSAGLYDYLDQPLATAVSTALFERVRVGGAVLVANFLPEVPDVGFMEVVMDWSLIFRTEGELAATFAPVADRAVLRTWSGPFGNIAYTLATRTA